MAPAARPSGIESKQKNQIELENAKPKSDREASKVLHAVTSCVPNLLISLELNMLAQIVPEEIRKLIRLFNPTSRLRSAKIAGQAEPSEESGMPNPM